MRIRPIRCAGALTVSVLALTLCSSCFVHGSKSKQYTISLPSTLRVYQNNDTLTYAFSRRIINGADAPTDASYTVKWEAISAPFPFTQTLQPGMKVTTSSVGSEAVQFVTQAPSGSAMGSVYLLGFPGTAWTWVDTDGVMNRPSDPTPVQTFWSPINDGVGNTSADVNRAASNAMNFGVMACATEPCLLLANSVTTEFSTTGAIEIFKPPAGEFETYKFNYVGTLEVLDATLTRLPDIRASCWTSGKTGTVSYSGSIWIYPAIGPVAISNSCTFNSNHSDEVIQLVKTNFGY